MKKNAMLKIAAILMVAVLLTTCAISSTFAKYATESSSSDEARVAKFGVTVATAADGIFATTRADANGKLIVESSDTDNVVAPGMSGATTTAVTTITGTPEVAVRVTNTFTVTLTGWTNDKCPLIFKVGTGTDAVTYSQGATETVTAFAARISQALTVTRDFLPNTNLAEEDAIQVAVLSWEWPFDSADEDVQDTALGNAAVSSDITVKVEIESHIDQIQTVEYYVAPETETETETTESDNGEPGEAQG